MITTATVALPDLADKINSYHRQCVDAVNTGLKHAKEAGQLLIEAKAQCPHGTWAVWLDDHFDGSDRTARVYMQVAKRWPEVESKMAESADLSIDGTLKLLAQQTDGTIRGCQTGEAEWYTPEEHVEAARQAMGGIDLDPASCKTANETVKAKAFYTAEDNGLDREWQGNVFLNPPYRAKDVTAFVDKLCESFECGSVTQAILLTNNATDTQWWHRAHEACAAVCFTSGRIRFYNPTGQAGNPPNGHTVFYFGDRVSEFTGAFGDFGTIVETTMQIAESTTREVEGDREIGMEETLPAKACPDCGGEDDADGDSVDSFDLLAESDRVFAWVRKCADAWPDEHHNVLRNVLSSLSQEV